MLGLGAQCRLTLTATKFRLMTKPRPQPQLILPLIAFAGNNLIFLYYFYVNKHARSRHLIKSMHLLRKQIAHRFFWQHFRVRVTNTVLPGRKQHAYSVVNVLSGSVKSRPGWDGKLCTSWKSATFQIQWAKIFRLYRLKLLQVTQDLLHAGNVFLTHRASFVADSGTKLYWRWYSCCYCKHHRLWWRWSWCYNCQYHSCHYEALK